MTRSRTDYIVFSRIRKTVEKDLGISSLTQVVLISPINQYRAVSVLYVYQLLMCDLNLFHTR